MAASLQRCYKDAANKVAVAASLRPYKDAASKLAVAASLQRCYKDAASKLVIAASLQRSYKDATSTMAIAASLQVDTLLAPEVTTSSGNFKPLDRSVDATGPAMAMIQSDHWQWWKARRLGCSGGWP